MTKFTINKTFEQALSRICLCVADDTMENRWGRPRIPLNCTLFAMVMKVIREESVRPFMVYLKTAFERGLIGTLPSRQVVEGALRNAEGKEYLTKAILYTADLLATVSDKRKHQAVRVVSGLRLAGRNYQTLINEVLCAKVAELTLKCCLYKVDIPRDVELTEDSLLTLLAEQIPETLPRGIREELYQEMVVAVLEGRIPATKMKNHLASLLRRVRPFDPSLQYRNGHRHLSIDTPASYHDSRTLRERLRL